MSIYFLYERIMPSQKNKKCYLEWVGAWGELVAFPHRRKENAVPPKTQYTAT